MPAHVNNADVLSGAYLCVHTCMESMNSSSTSDFNYRIINQNCSLSSRSSKNPYVGFLVCFAFNRKLRLFL